MSCRIKTKIRRGANASLFFPHGVNVVMSDHVQCSKCFEVKVSQEVRDNDNRCPECGGKNFRDT